MRKFCLLLCALACAAGWYWFAGAEEGETATPVQAENPAPRAETVRVDGARVLALEAQADPIYLSVWDEGRTVRMDMEDYLVCAVAGEMPASYEMEALKAQAVAARSYLAWKMPAFGGGGCSQGVDTDVCTDSTHCMAYWSEEDMRAQWGEDYAENRARIEEAVRATAGEVMLYNDSPIQALFHSSSGGQTEDAQAVWGTAYPYLTSVQSEGEEESGQYAAEVRMPVEELVDALNDAFPGANLTRQNVETAFSVRSRTESGRADVVQIGEVTATGRAGRTALDLRSTNFTIDYEGDEAVLSTLGYGHGVGMSQVGANVMA
ncbi:MAG: stage II sporulation protein D, partial [Candidatus Spyradocola sp.]